MPKARAGESTEKVCKMLGHKMTESEDIFVRSHVQQAEKKARRQITTREMILKAVETWAKEGYPV